jgi:hypothetical protein
MRRIKFGALLFLLFLITNCEKKDDLVNMTMNARVVGFVMEKCYCCWGWIIDIDRSFAIKTDFLPGLSPSENYYFPINARITIGNKIRDCSAYKVDMDPRPDYYEIKEFTIIK